MKIIYELVEPLMESMTQQSIDDLPTVMKTKSIKGEFVRLVDLNDYKFSIPYEVLIKMRNRLSNDIVIDFYERKVLEARLEVLYFRLEVWRRNFFNMVNEFLLNNNPYKSEIQKLEKQLTSKEAGES